MDASVKPFERILFAGDVHGDMAHILPILRTERPAALVLLGDIQTQVLWAELTAPWETLGCTVWFIPGNHDSDTVEGWAHLAAVPERNLDGRVVTIAGVRIAGLGGVFRGRIWDGTQSAAFASHADYAACVQAKAGRAGGPSEADRGRLLRHHSSIFPETYETLAAQSADILVTHEAPSCHPHGFAAIDTLAQCLRVARVFHGHHHDNQDYGDRCAPLRFVAQGVGLRGVTDGTGRVIRPGLLDHARGSR
ncbi:metallophosphoesterase [Acidiferrobacter sp. SPIII_3]|jgi:predicted phosphodiesterase|uniref:metallophosphoesterase family protein n=1 Tax=Acidiferrobacter sp. SPIII_3 TaxID=1281578 RepID=UPI000D73E5F0|nr:metallophosphoesterase [Acidiferrobacter sp. SPIII_3]AWP23577.1 metallophosphoesterase [Acidiferrobacter sp. SPIII_3]